MIELIERDVQLAQLRDHMTAATNGTGRIVLISGEAGIGKTTLMREFAAADGGAKALWWGACDALQTPAPLAPLYDIASSAEVSFRQLLERPVKRMQLFGEVIRELQALGPALLVIEDAHWADESTLDLVRFIGRRIDRTRTLLAVTFRQDEVSASHPLRIAIGDLPQSLTTRMELEPLSPAAVATLARRALRSPTGLYEATGGNPFFVTELLRHGSAEMPRSIQDLVLARFARLPSRAREIVQLAAIAPARVERWLVDEVLGPTAADIDCCLDSGLLLADDDSLFFRHELARVAVEQAMQVCEPLHAKALEALARRGRPAEHAARLVHHAVRANAREAVIAYAPLAAREARDRGAHREAAAHYRMALRHADGLPAAEHLELLEAFATQAQATNQFVEAIAARERSAQLLAGGGNPLAEGRNLSRLAIVLVHALRTAEGRAASRRAIELLEALPPGVELADAYRIESQLRMVNRDCREAVKFGVKAIELAKRLGARAELAAAYITVGSALIFIDCDSGCEYLHRGLEISLADDLDQVTALCYASHGAACVETVSLHCAGRLLRQAIEFTTTKEIDFYRTYALAWLGACDLALGQWEVAETHASEALAAAPESSTARIIALCTLGRIQARRGASHVDAAFDEALRLALPSDSLQRIAPVRIARAEAAHQRGDRARVIEEAGAALELARAHEHAWYVGELSYWLWLQGEPTAPIAECAEPYALQFQGRWHEAAEMWSRLECPYEQARALCDGTNGARLEAIAIFERLGARVCADAVRKSLRAAGVRGVPRGPRASTQRNPRGLTAREIEVLDLLCRGLRNSKIAEHLFRSVRTVEHHVNSILGKLDAESRVEVLAIARREGLLPRIGSEQHQGR